MTIEEKVYMYIMRVDRFLVTTGQVLKWALPIGCVLAVVLLLIRRFKRRAKR